MTEEAFQLKRYTADEMRERNRLAELDQIPAGYRERWYTEAELDELYERNPRESLEVSRRQELARREAVQEEVRDPPPLTEEGVRDALEEARRVLLRDGGDLELVALEGTVVRVRLKGACVGCPNSVLDLKTVVEKTVRRRFPQVTEGLNSY